VFSISPFPILRFGSAAAVLCIAIVLVLMLSLWAAELPWLLSVHVLTFYAITAGAYAALPFIRRGDILMVASWLVLGAGVAPCFAGQELSAPHLFADMAGVVMAAGPIYIARYRQMAQGDTRPSQRREGEPAAVAKTPGAALPDLRAPVA
jgi:uncharacterized membrane protein